MFNPEKIKNECVNWIKKFFKENGKDCNAVIGISGGKDSSVATALCVEALGKDRVIGVLMPCGEQHDIDCAYALVNHLGIKHYVINVKDSIEGLKNSFPDNLPLSTQAITNLPPRIRMSTLYAVSQSVNGRVVNTCNLSEDWVGYSTRYGDAAGDFSPLSNLTVAEIKQIGALLGLPDELVNKAIPPPTWPWHSRNRQYNVPKSSAAGIEPDSLSKSRTISVVPLWSYCSVTLSHREPNHCCASAAYTSSFHCEFAYTFGKTKGPAAQSLSRGYAAPAPFAQGSLWLYSTTPLVH